MLSAFQNFGHLGAPAGAPWSERALYPAGASSPGLWIDPAYTAGEFQDSAGTTPISTIGTVADTSNPVGLILDRKGNLALGAELAPGGGTFDSSTGWNVPAEWSISGGVATHSGTINNLTPSTPILTIGKTYQIQVNILAAPTGFQVSAGGTYSGTGLSLGVNTLRLQCTADTTLRLQAATGQATVLESISVKEIPGIHLSQSTSAARPLASARVNLLTYSEDFSNAAWEKQGTIGTTSAIKENTSNAEHYSNQRLTKSASAIPVTFSIKFKNNTGSRNFAIGLTDGTTGGWCSIFSTAGAVVASSQAVGSTTGWTFTSSSISAADADGFYTALISLTTNTSTRLDAVVYLVDGTVRNYTGDGTSTIHVKQAKVEYGSTATAYQRVGAASDYAATGFPAYTKLDGVDDALSSATFSAGTLTSSMDCLIPVRRDSTASVVCAYVTGDANKYFGAAVSAGAPNACAGSGSPTIFVDGVQLSGGTSVTQGTLNTALTPGAWHIVEFRGLNLSTWTNISVGNYASGFQLNGALGKIGLFASGQDSNRDKARARMAQYFGVTLP